MAAQDNNTLLQSVFAVFNSDVQVLYNEMAEELTALLDNGVPLNKAVDQVFKDVGYNREMESLYSSSLGTISKDATLGTVVNVDKSLASEYFLYNDFQGGNLSSRIRSSHHRTIVKQALRDAFKVKTSVEELFRKIPTDTPTIKKLPKTITNVISSFERVGYVDNEVLAALREARLSVSNLTNIEKSSQQLKNSYSKVLDAIEKQDDVLLKKAVDNAINKKLGYENKRIARTEMARAYEMSFQRGMYEDDGITGFQVVLSSRHAIPDECDCYAEADLYGLGPGIAPIDAGINIPFHPNCLCGKLYIRGDEKTTARKSFSEKRLEKYLDSVDRSKRVSIVGAKYSDYKKDYLKGLQKRGFSITQNPNMIPQTIFTIV